MKLIERYGDPDFHTCVATTFGVDFEAYEQLALSRLRGASCYNNLLVADADMLTYALDGASLPPRWAGRHYSVIGAPARGVFHPKLTLQLGRGKGRLMIASANMTASGQGGNLELVGEVNCDSANTSEARLIAAAWRYLAGLLEKHPQEGVTHQLRWLQARTPWLLQTPPADGPEVLSDGTRAAFLAHDPRKGIGRRFAELVGDPVKRLVILSPYWDDDLSALRALAEQLGTQEIVILIDSQQATFPGDALSGLPETSLYDLAGFRGGRFIHAKAILAQTQHADHLLVGSANCTWAALGDAESGGINEEACLYRQLAPNTVLPHLGLETCLKQTPLAVEGLPPRVSENPLPLEDVGRRFPGTFEFTQGVLIWNPPATGMDAATLELLDADHEPLPATVTLTGPKDTYPRRYLVSQATHRPAFARWCWDDGTLSASGIVTDLDALREHVRDKRSRQTESLAFRLSEETEEGLWLLDVLDSLEASSAHQGQHRPGASYSQSDNRSAQDNAADYSVLPYGEFIAGRQAYQNKQEPASSSLAGSDLSLIRGFLNRILGMDDTVSSPEGAEYDTPVDFSLGDEVGDADEALERGGNFADSSSPPKAERTLEARQHEQEAELARKAEVRATRNELVTAVARYCERYRQRQGNRQKLPLTVTDALRLRALLIILAAAGQSGKSDAQATNLQVLPHSKRRDGWPMLMGLVLCHFFEGKPPPVLLLEIEKTEGAMPVDLLECWGTCLWALYACAEALVANNASETSLRPLQRLSKNIYTLMGVSHEEVFHGPLKEAFQRANERFADRLGLSMSTIKQHQEAAYASRQQTRTVCKQHR